MITTLRIEYYLNADMKRIIINALIIILVCCAQCITFQDGITQKNNSDSLYTYRTASPGGTEVAGLRKRIFFFCRTSPCIGMCKGTL